MERADVQQPATAEPGALDLEPPPRPQQQPPEPYPQNDAEFHAATAAEENKESLPSTDENQQSISLETPSSPDLDVQQQQLQLNESVGLTDPEKEEEAQTSQKELQSDQSQLDNTCAPTYNPQHSEAHSALLEAPVPLDPQSRLTEEEEEEGEPRTQAQTREFEENNPIEPTSEEEGGPRTQAHAQEFEEHNPTEPTLELAAALRQRKSSNVTKAPLHRALNQNIDKDNWVALRRPPSFPKRKRIKSWAAEGEVHRILHQSFSSDYETDDDTTDDDDSAFFSQAPTPRRRTSSRVTAAALALKHGKALGHSNSSTHHQLNRSGVEQEESKLPPLPGRSSQQQSQQPQQPPPRYVNPYLIPVQHPLKSLWDILTVLLSIYNAYLTHKALKSRQFSNSGWIEAWFVADILLNFVTQRHTADGTLLTSFTSVWARYLTSWFVIDVLALFPGESLYIAPVIELQRKRKFWNKVTRRTKLSVKITTRILQSGYVSWLYKLFIKARGVREITRVIKQIVYWVRWVVRYFSFMKHMKGLLAVRLLRDWGHLRRWTRVGNNKEDDHSTVDLTSDEGGATPHPSQRAEPSWEYVEEEEDPVPF